MHKSTVFQPAPVALRGNRYEGISKHAAGRAPKKVCGQHVAGRTTRGATGGKVPQLRIKPLPPRPGRGGTPTRKAHKAEFLAQSSEDAKRLANEKSIKRLYADWRASMTPEERAAARGLKCLQPLAHDGAPAAPRGRETDVTFHDPAELPEARDERTAVDVLEPQSPFSVAIESLDCQEITDAAECFGAALTWALDVPDQRELVLIGKRSLAVIYMLYPDLVTGAERDQAKQMIPIFEDVPFLAEEYDALATGEIFGRVLEWVRRGTTVSEIGERLCLVAYVVRPTMMGSPTLHQLGEVMNKTRQAKDKLASCLRDTFAGIRAMAQRGEHTRDKCIAAH